MSAVAAPRPSRPEPLLALVGGAVVATIALFVSLLAFHTADAESLRRAQLDHRRDELDLVEARLAVETLALDAATARLLEAVDGQTVVVTRTDAAGVRATLERLAQHPGPLGDDAALLAGLLGAGGDLDEIGPADAMALADATREAGRSSAGDAVADELRAGADRVAFPARILHGALAAAGSPRSGGVLDDDAARSLAAAVGAPASVADRDAMVVTPWLAELDGVLAAHGLPTTVRELEQILIGERVAPSLTPVELTEQATAAADQLHAVLADHSSTVRAELDAEHRASDLRGARFRIAGWALVVLAVVVAAAALAVAFLGRREIRTPVRLPEVDDATGLLTPAAMRRVSTRHLLDRRFSQHLVGVIRIARIEMIADAYGSAAAERVESVIARRLQAATIWLAGGRADAAAVLTRRGAGEFLVTLHAARHIDVDLVRRVLLLRSGTAFPLGDDHVPVGYGVGLHLELGTADLDEALDAAERAILEHPVGRDLAPRPISTPLALVRSH